MQIHFLENLAKPSNGEITIKQNIELKVMNQTLEMGLKQLKKANCESQYRITRTEGGRERGM